MNLLYLAFAPLFFLTFSKRTRRLVAAVKSKNRDQIKVEALFMGLTLGISLVVLMSLQRLSA